MVRSDIGCWFKAPVFSCQLPALRMTSNPKEPSRDTGVTVEKFWPCGLVSATGRKRWLV